MVSPLVTRDLGGAAIDPDVDEVEHNHPVEWWYFVGHLEAQNGRRFGFEFTCVRLGFGTWPLTYYAYFSVSDIQEQIYRSAERLDGNAYSQTAEGFAFEFEPNGPQTGDWTLETTAGGELPRYHLGASFQAKHDQFAMELDLESVKPAFLQGTDGIVDFGGINIAYYTRPRLKLEGEIISAGQYFPVEGVGWMDHQWGKIRVGDRRWKFFAIQLDDKHEVCLITVVTNAGDHLSHYWSIVDAEGAVETLEEVAIEEVGDPWGPQGYPLKHRILVPSHGLDMLVSAAFEDQRRVPSEPTDISIPELIFWEGSCDVLDENGDPIGHAYMELGGYE